MGIFYKTLSEFLWGNKDSTECHVKVLLPSLICICWICCWICCCCCCCCCCFESSHSDFHIIHRTSGKACLWLESSKNYPVPWLFRKFFFWRKIGRLPCLKLAFSPLKRVYLQEATPRSSLFRESFWVPIFFDLCFCDPGIMKIIKKGGEGWLKISSQVDEIRHFPIWRCSEWRLDDST